MNKLILGVLVILGLGGLAFAGRNMFQGVTEQGEKRLAEEVIKNATGGQVDFSQDRGTFSVTNEDGSATAAYGTNVSLPANFPTDVPTPQSGNLITAYGGQDNNQPSFALVYMVAGSDVTNVSQSYQNQLRAAGFTIENSGAVSGIGSSVSGFTATRADTSVNVAITSDGTSTSFSLTVTRE